MDRIAAILALVFAGLAPPEQWPAAVAARGPASLRTLAREAVAAVRVLPGGVASRRLSACPVPLSARYPAATMRAMLQIYRI